VRTQLVFSATLFAATLVLGAGNFVYAGALLEPPGDGQVITTATFSSTRRAFGKLVPIPTYEKFELASYIEYGLTDRLALIARPSFSAFPAGSSGSSTNISSDLGLRIGVVDTANIAISVQDEIHAPVRPHDQHEITFDDPAVFSNDLSLSFASESYVVRCSSSLCRLVPGGENVRDALLVRGAALVVIDHPRHRRHRN
jgi:hypothetical protein